MATRTIEPAYLQAAIEAALKAGELIRAGFLMSPDRLEITHKGAVDLVTHTDYMAQEAVVDILTRRFPDCGVIAEEGLAEQPDDDRYWLVDPLDGTTNFAHRHPHCAVSIALMDAGEPVVGVTFDPMRQELFSAEKFGRAELNGEAIRVSSIDTLNCALLATGFPYDRQEKAHLYVPAVEAFMRDSQGLRRLGSASLDLAWLACGRLDGYWEPGLEPWDVAAGVVLVQAAGGQVTTYRGGPLDVLQPTTILASNGLLHAHMVNVLTRLSEGTGR